MPSAWAFVSLLALTASIAQIGFNRTIRAQVQSAGRSGKRPRTADSVQP